jgi:hypothetical protein
VTAVLVGSVTLTVQSVNPTAFPLVQPSTSSTVPTQFIAKQYTEGLGRAPTADEWGRWIRFFSRPAHSCGARSMAVLGHKVFLSHEFNRLGYRRVEALSALSRALLNHDLDATTYDRYRSPRSRWPQVLDAILRGSVFRHKAAAICRARQPGYNFDNSVRPLQTATGPGFRGIAAQLQTALDAKARSGGGIVWLARAAVIYVDRHTPMGGLIHVPAGVELATIGRPGPRSYEKMARLVRIGTTCLLGSSCDQPVLAVDGSSNPPTLGGQVQAIWIDGGGGNPLKAAKAGSTVQLDSGANSAITGSRLDAPIPRPPGGGTTLGLQGIGNDPGLPCSHMRVTGNLLTAYSTDHFLTRRWADGITVDCEDARVEHNTIVDATDAGIALFGNSGVDQRSLIRENYILSAGNDAYSALDVDPRGVCNCGGTSIRDFAGSSIDDNTFITGPRTGFGFGVNLGIRPLIDHPPDGTGAAATNNGTGRGTARVNVGLAVSGMFDATLAGNTGHFILVHINGCPLLKSAASVSAGLASFASPPQPYADIAIISCWPTPSRHHRTSQTKSRMIGSVRPLTPHAPGRQTELSMMDPPRTPRGMGW